MRKIIGIGETLFNIVFRNNQPEKSVPSGAVFNCMISLGRLGLNPCYISEVGRDNIGELILGFMTQNGVSTENMYSYYDGKSPVSLMFIDEKGEAQYDSYINYPDNRLEIVWPRIDAGDIILFGSYYSLNPLLRKSLTELMDYAADRKAIICYDMDFHKEHSGEVLWIMPSLIENLEYATIVRASREDLINIYKESDIDKAYRNHIRFYCNIFICTDKGDAVHLRTPLVSKSYDVSPLGIKYPVGAGDAFNAGLIYALTANEITSEMIAGLDEKTWDKIVAEGIRFAHNVCQNKDAFISEDFSKNFKV